MLTSGEAVYLDSSALVKLVAIEAESDALTEFLKPRPRRVSCTLARVEVIRAVSRFGPLVVARARDLLADTYLLRLDQELLDAAAEMLPGGLRSLDAIHLAAARTIGTSLGELVTYDRRMAEAAGILGLVVATPGREP